MTDHELHFILPNSYFILSDRSVMTHEKIAFSGIQPTGELHFGNYFGAVKNWVALQSGGEYKCVYCVVDLHAMTMPYDPAILKKNTEGMYTDLLASGLDPNKAIVFVQSQVPEHTELAWVFSCLASYGDLTRQAQFKDKSEQVAAKAAEDATKGEFISAGLFTYPVLQAADILLYRSGYVPVGKDQEQHLEMSRSIAKRFNYQFGEEYFPEPQMLATETPKLLSLADPTKKMSKSLGPKHYIGMFEDEKGVRSKVKSAVTDTGVADVEMSPGVDNLLALLRACDKQTLADSFAAEYAKGEQRRYSPLKEAVADALVELTSTMRARREEVSKDREYVRKTMWDSAQKARDIAGQTIKDVRRLAGLPKR